MNAISLLTTRAVIVTLISSVSPHGPCSFVKTELTGSFTKSVNSLGWNLQIELHELICEDEIRMVGVDITNILLP